MPVAYLRSRVINLLNLHYGIQALATNAGGVFVFVYLLKAGVELPIVFLALALIMMSRFVLRPLVLVVGKRSGIKPLVAFGAASMASQYAILPFVHGPDISLFFLCLAGAISDVFYWTAFHACFAQLGDDASRGHQTSARESLAAAIGVVAPLLGGWALSTLGALSTFGVIAGIQILSVLPLLGTPNVPVPHTAPGAYRQATLGAVLFAADGWISTGYVIAWQIALFVSLKQSFTAFGGATALASLAGAASGLLLGRQIDLGRGLRVIAVAFGAFFIALILRVTSVGMPGLAVLANALGAFIVCLYQPAMLAPVYTAAKQASCVLRFHIVAEGGADLGCTSASLLAAAMTARGLPLSAVIATSAAVAVASLWVLLRYYRGVGREGPLLAK